MKKYYYTLLEFPKNKYGTIYEIGVGKNIEKRLMSMGIRKGSEIKKLNQSSGTLSIKVGETNVAIGRDLAYKIIIEY